MTGSVLRGALVGFGGVAEHGHLPGFQCDPRFEICAVVDPEQAARERAVRASSNRIRSYSSLGACLSSERLDFVNIASPPSEHLEAIQRATGAGLPSITPYAVPAAAAVPVVIGAASSRAWSRSNE